MGVIASVQFELVNFTPFSLRYLMTTTGEAGDTVLGNTGVPGPFPDLRVDASRGAEWGPLPILYHLLRTEVADQAEARRVLLGEFGLPVAPRGAHAQVELTPRGQVSIAGPIEGPGGHWSVDADEGAHAGHAASADHAVLIFSPPTEDRADTECYLTIRYKHSRRDGSSLVIPPNLPFVLPGPPQT